MKVVTMAYLPKGKILKSSVKLKRTTGTLKGSLPPSDTTDVAKAPMTRKPITVTIIVPSFCDDRDRQPISY